MNGKHSSSRVNDEMGNIKKGPWKAEEDEVLVHHVKRYGPRDWSSIRSKGLLHRTGKSCRLRWVNKLRPNLKNGVKFSADEERVVIELQEEFGNRWARIATYLPGRTDNDVKNFWSSRQKRLARLLHTPVSSSSSSKSHRTNKHAHAAVRTVPSVKVSKFSSINQDETFPNSQSFSASFVDQSQTLKLVPFPDLMQTISFTYEQSCLQSDLNTAEKIPCTENTLSYLSLPLQSDFTPLVKNHDLETGLYQGRETLETNLDWAPEKIDDYVLLDANYPDPYGETSFSELSDLQLPPLTCLECERSSEVTVKKQICPVTESLLDDLPLDVFDHIDPLPSPSYW